MVADYVATYSVKVQPLICISVENDNITWRTCTINQVGDCIYIL